MKKSIVMRFYCKHKECKAFKIVFDRKINLLRTEVILDLYESPNPVHHSVSSRRPLKGENKRILQEKLRLRKPKTQEMIDALNMNERAKANKDLDTLCTRNVYTNNRKAALAIHDQDPDFCRSLEKIKIKMDAEKPEKSYLASLQWFVCTVLNKSMQ